MKDELRIESRIRNNRLYECIFSNYESVAGFSRKHNLSNVLVGELLNLKRSPLDRYGEYLELVKKISEIFKMLEEDLFPLSIYKIKQTKGVTTISHDNFVSIEQAENKMIEDIENRDLAHMLNKIIDGFNEREKLVLNLRYGLNDNKVHTIQKIADKMNVSTSRIRQIEWKAIRRLQDSSRKNYLLDYCDQDIQNHYDGQFDWRKRLMLNPEHIKIKEELMRKASEQSYIYANN